MVRAAPRGIISIPVVATPRFLELSVSPIVTEESDMGVIETFGRTLLPPLSDLENNTQKLINENMKKDKVKN